MWRSQVKANLYGPFFDLLRSVYILQGPPTYTYAVHLFDSWDVSSMNEEWELIPHVSDDDGEADDDVPSQVQQRPQPQVFGPSQQSEIFITSGSEQSSIVCGQVHHSKNQQAGTSSATSSLLRELFSGSETDHSTNQPPSDFVCGQVPHSSQQQAGTSSANDCPKVQRPETRGP